MLLLWPIAAGIFTRPVWYILIKVFLAERVLSGQGIRADQGLTKTYKVVYDCSNTDGP